MTNKKSDDTLTLGSAGSCPALSMAGLNLIFEWSNLTLPQEYNLLVTDIHTHAYIVHHASLITYIYSTPGERPGQPDPNSSVGLHVCEAGGEG